MQFAEIICTQNSPYVLPLPGWFFFTNHNNLFPPSIIYQYIWGGTCGANVLLMEWQVQHDDVIKWKHFPLYWPFVRGIHRSITEASDAELWSFLWFARTKIEQTIETPVIWDVITLIRTSLQWHLPYIANTFTTWCPGDVSSHGSSSNGIDIKLLPCVVN